jgi:hypothetical protein
MYNLHPAHHMNNADFSVVNTQSDLPQLCEDFTELK